MWLFDKLKQMGKKLTEAELSKEQAIDKEIEEAQQQMRTMQKELNELSVKHRDLLRQRAELEAE